MSDLHVLEDLGQPEGGGAQHPGEAPPGRDHLETADQGQATLQRDDRADVLGVTLAERGLDLLVEFVELAPECLDLLGRETMQRVV